MNSKKIDFRGLRVTLQKPRVVAERSQGRCWYPDLLKFSTGELMLNHSLNADRNDNPQDTQAVYLSTDEGHSFDMTYDVDGLHNSGGEARICTDDGQTWAACQPLLKGTQDGTASRSGHLVKTAESWI